MAELPALPSSLPYTAAIEAAPSVQLAVLLRADSAISQLQFILCKTDLPSLAFLLKLKIPKPIKKKSSLQDSPYTSF